MNVVLVFCLLFCCFSAIVCSSSETYVKFYKKSTYQASVESWRILYNGTALYTSPELTDESLYTEEVCLPTRGNDQYMLRLYDINVNSWSNGSYLEILGKYDQIFYKGFLVNSRIELHTLSLYTPIPRGVEWRYSIIESSEWNKKLFDDSSWSTITLGTPYPLPHNTQYFRKVFMGLAGLAAYEVRFTYRYGLIAYMNGKEIYRDNMPEGVVTASTRPSHSYLTTLSKGIIRSAREASNSSLLAVEMHFPSEIPEIGIDFDVFLSMYANDTNEMNCYNYDYSLSVAASAGIHPEFCLNNNKLDYYFCASVAVAQPVLSFYLNGSSLPVVNYLRLYPYLMPATLPSFYTLQGAFSSTAEFATVVSASGAHYETEQWSGRTTGFREKAYSHYKLHITGSLPTDIRIYELRFAVCNFGSEEEIAFPSSSYLYYALYERVDIHPLVDDYASCSLSPSLPLGLVFNTSSCSISGVATIALPETLYTMRTTFQGVEYTGSFRLRIRECNKAMIEVNRVYGVLAALDTISIVDEFTDLPVLSYSLHNASIDYTQRKDLLCLTGSSYRLVISGSFYWSARSYVYVSRLLAENQRDRLLRANMDYYLGLATTYSFDPRSVFEPRQPWSYLFGEFPADWKNSTGEGWAEAALGSFPASSNRLQLYKKAFTVKSLRDIVGFVLSLRYISGCIVYMNGIEVFRNHLPAGEITLATVPTHSYAAALYRQVSLLIRTYAIDGVPAIQYLQTGNNVITVAIMAENDEATAAVFDASLRLMSSSVSSRTFDYSILDAKGIEGGDGALVYSWSTSWFSTSCDTSNYAIVQFNEDRREWISSVIVQNHYDNATMTPGSITISGRESEAHPWTIIKVVTGMRYSSWAQEKKIWLKNNRPYNQYRFSSIASSDPLDCTWFIGRIDLLCDDTSVDVPDLAYPSYSTMRDVEMVDVSPNSVYYSDFSVTPALPEGVFLDVPTGVISGTPTKETPLTDYLIHANRYNGAMSSANFTFVVELCFEMMGVVTITTFTDNWYFYSAGYKIYRGRGTSGDLILEESGFDKENTYFYLTQCLPRSIYTINFEMGGYDGMRVPGGYMVSLDLGNLRVDMNHIPASDYLESEASSVFSTFIPFQVRNTEWKVWRDGSVAEGWKQVSFDDSTWSVVKASQIGTATPTTIYVRRTFSITNKDDYHVLNVRVRYNGGVVAYFNGKKVARFNLIEDFDEATPGLTSHDASTFSKFHIILGIVGIAEGNNVIAFELHRAAGTSTATAFEFDATGVFGVQDCDAVMDSYSFVGGTPLNSGSFDQVWDLDPGNTITIRNEAGSFLQWTVENLEGTKFNKLALYPFYDHHGWGASLYSRQQRMDPFGSIWEEQDIALSSRLRKDFNVSQGLVGYSEFYLKYDAEADSTIAVGSYALLYCQASGSFCPGDGEYPPVYEGEDSPGPCNAGYRGYSYRICSNGVLSEVKYDRCKYKLPVNLRYAQTEYTFVGNISMKTDTPTYKNIISSFGLSEGQRLPTGLELDAATGVISGIAREIAAVSDYVVLGRNPTGAMNTTLRILVRKAACMEDDIPKGYVDDVSVYDCSNKGSYIGTQKRTCVLGKEDGEWSMASGMCVPVYVVVMIVCFVAAFIGISIMVFVKLRKEKDRKERRKKRGRIQRVMQRDPLL